jgi:hypothetical protein
MKRLLLLVFLGQVLVWFVLPLPSFVLHPYTAMVIAAVHVYLSMGHLSKLFGGDLVWAHFWKGLGGACVFAAPASLGVCPDTEVKCLLWESWLPGRARDHSPPLGFVFRCATILKL